METNVTVMGSWQARLFSALLRRTFKRLLAVADDAAAARRLLNSYEYPLPKDVRVTPGMLGSVPGEWLEPQHAARTGAALLYLHGGGYFACSPRTHRAATSFFARQGMRVFVPDYRLAPEHPFPAAIDDAQAAYAALLRAGCDPARLALAGDSAGGGLALSLLLRLREQRMPLPAAAAVFSPLTDLAATGASLHANRERCAMFLPERITSSARFYLAGADPRTPAASPLYGDLHGLPPLLIHVAEDEILRDDSTRLAQRAQCSGVPVTLRVWPAVPHVWQLFHWFIPEGRQSLAEAAAFIRRATTAALRGTDARVLTELHG